MGAKKDQVAVIAAPREEHPGEARLQPPPPAIDPPQFGTATWSFVLTPVRSDVVEFAIMRDPEALQWPLRLTVEPAP